MKTKLLNYFCVFTFLFTAFSCSEDESTIELLPNDTAVTNEILNLVNEHRQGLGLSSLQKNGTADQLAIEHTRYMISQNQISHDGGDAKFKKLQEDENAQRFGENVAAGQRTAQAVMISWLNSTTGHRENIEGNYTHIGIGAVKNENGTYYYTQIFYR